jgi:serine/threonine-protein phosphatase 4 regulatory subunit 1
MEMFRPATSSSGSGTNASHAIIPPTNGPSSANNSSSSQSTFDPRFDAHPTDPALPRGPPATDQDIVPQLLIDHFVSMIDPSRAQTVDSDIARHCAFSLPAVALTLGRSNWPLLKDTYEALATDMQWKVRRTLASSIHELGAILGPEASANDLIPVFNGFLKDLDEVRIGLLKHLGDFLVLLDMDRRREYLPKLPDFLKMDNDRNWRFRLELTEQLEKLLPLYSPADVDEHVSPMVMVLIRDKVASVRRLATNVLSSILLALNNSENPDLAQNLVKIIVEAQAMDSHWVHRQTYASLTYQVHATNALEPPQLAESLMPSLLELSEDRVANVRLAVARTLSRIDIETDFYKNNQVDDCRLRIETVEMNLKNDSDVDVRAFYGGSQKRYGNSGSLEEGTAAESTTNVSADDEDAEDHCVPAENSKTEEDSGSSRREVEVEEEEDDQDDDEDDVGVSTT